MDSGFTEELESLSKTPDRAMDMSSAGSRTRERGGKLYGLLAGLLRGRAQQTLKAVPSGDGYEGWRQLLLILRPVTKNRGLAIMAAIMAWPNLQMSSALQPQFLRLEESFDETKRAGVSVQEGVKVAVLLQCLSGQLRTHVSLQLSEGMSYFEFRSGTRRNSVGVIFFQFLLMKFPWKWVGLSRKAKARKVVKMRKERAKGPKVLEKTARTSPKVKMASQTYNSQKGKTKKGNTGKGKGFWTNDTKGKGKFASHGQQFHTVTSDVTDAMARSSCKGLSRTSCPRRVACR